MPFISGSKWRQWRWSGWVHHWVDWCRHYHKYKITDVHSTELNRPAKPSPNPHLHCTFAKLSPNLRWTLSVLGTTPTQYHNSTATVPEVHLDHTVPLSFFCPLYSVNETRQSIATMPQDNSGKTCYIKTKQVTPSLHLFLFYTWYDFVGYAIRLLTLGAHAQRGLQ